MKERPLDIDSKTTSPAYTVPLLYGPTSSPIARLIDKMTPGDIPPIGKIVKGRVIWSLMVAMKIHYDYNIAFMPL